MENFTNNYQKNQAKPADKAFWLTFRLLGIGAEWLDAGLPTPHYLRHHHALQQYIAAWAIVGYFGTPKAKAFLLDVVARFLLEFPEAERLPWKPKIRKDGHRLNAPPYELRELAAVLPSLPWDHSDTRLASFVDEAIQEAKEAGKEIRGEDALFEATRWHLYRRAYAEGHTRNITEDYVRVMLQTENQLLARPRPPGDIKAKARRMAEYMQNEFVVYTNIAGYAEWSKEKRAEYMRNYRDRKGLVMATREEHIRKVHAQIREKSRRKVIGLITGLYADEYRRGQSWNISKLAADTGMSRNTVARIIKEWQQDEKTL
jgi:hypothetical protein